MAGGLGNQMFQYALARVLENKGRKVLLDCSEYKLQSQTDTVRTYELDRFSIKIAKASQKEIARYYNCRQRCLYYLGRIIKKDLSRIIIEKEHRYLPQIAECDNKYLIGYWQSERYFKTIRKELMGDFSLQNCKLSQKNKKVCEELFEVKNSVAVHIRGGDYIMDGNIAIYGDICTKEYYQKAFAYIEKMIGQAQYYIFTNDVTWTQQVLPVNNKNIQIIDWNTEEDGWIDMYLMSLCKHNIIANSSFSWWAAWLNQNTEKVVIAPSKWQNGSDIEDIVPEEWVRV